MPRKIENESNSFNDQAELASPVTKRDKTLITGLTTAGYAYYADSLADSKQQGPQP
ncbi:MAG: hypothetical protein MK110_02725 [Fuerstiella sp.]|nr:hypothetical protein [Fuerstiella sp.]